MDVLMDVIGLATDPKKSDDHGLNMLGLGHWVIVSPSDGTVKTRFDEEKAARWHADLKELMKTGQCPAALAGKFAGRFSCAVTVQHDKSCRAYIR